MKESLYYHLNPMKTGITLLPLSLPSSFSSFHGMPLSNAISPLEFFKQYQAINEDMSIFVSLVHFMPNCWRLL